MTEGKLSEMVENWEIANIVCKKTGQPIFAGQEMYWLFHETYHISVNMEELIDKLTSGKETIHSLYEAEVYYYTEHDDNESVFKDIISQGYYYDRNGRLTTFKKIN